MTDNSIKCPKNIDAVDAFSLVCSRMKELNHLYGQNSKEWVNRNGMQKSEKRF